MLVTNVFEKNLFQQLEWQLTQVPKASYSFCKQEYSTSICYCQITESPSKILRVICAVNKASFYCMVSILMLIRAADNIMYSFSNGVVDINFCCTVTLIYYCSCYCSVHLGYLYLCTIIQLA